jgi:putative ABC transport system permease protein
VLGVVLGVAAVIAMMSVGEGAREAALEQIESLGLDNLVARNPAGVAPASGGHLVRPDTDRLLSVMPFAVAASPLVEQYGPVSRRGASVVTSILGVESSFHRILDLAVERGRGVTPLDDRLSPRSCVIGSGLAWRLFGSTPPVGEVLRVQGEYCPVVGVLASRSGDPRTSGVLAWRDLNQAVLMPVGAMTGRARAPAGQPVDEIWIRTSRGDLAEELGRILAHALARLHPGRAPFEIVVPRALLAQRYRTQRTFSVVLGSIATIALIVGGIGIMNIMLTSVTERTREIGVRRAVGATRRDVTAQFLVESLLMTMGGGAIGIVGGVAVSAAITAYAGWDTHVSMIAIGLGFGVSAVVGLVFGLYPALQAARSEPVEALHHE